MAGRNSAKNRKRKLDSYWSLAWSGLFTAARNRKGISDIGTGVRRFQDIFRFISAYFTSPYIDFAASGLTHQRVPNHLTTCSMHCLCRFEMENGIMYTHKEGSSTERRICPNFQAQEYQSIRQAKPGGGIFNGR